MESCNEWSYWQWFGCYSYAPKARNANGRVEPCLARIRVVMWKILHKAWQQQQK